MCIRDSFQTALGCTVRRQITKRSIERFSKETVYFEWQARYMLATTGRDYQCQTTHNASTVAINLISLSSSYFICGRAPATMTVSTEVLAPLPRSFPLQSLTPSPLVTQAAPRQLRSADQPADQLICSWISESISPGRAGSGHVTQTTHWDQLSCQTHSRSHCITDVHWSMHGARWLTDASAAYFYFLSQDFIATTMTQALLSYSYRRCGYFWRPQIVTARPDLQVYDSKYQRFSSTMCLKKQWCWILA